MHHEKNSTFEIQVMNGELRIEKIIIKNILGGSVKIVYDTMNGNNSSCIHDAFLNIRNMYGFKLMPEIWEFLPPKNIQIPRFQIS